MIIQNGQDKIIIHKQSDGTFVTADFVCAEDIILKNKPHNDNQKETPKL